MLHFPNPLSSRYQIASSQQILSWSYGKISRVCEGGETDWQTLRHTLFDQAIFGPKRDYYCMCGKFTNRPDFETLRDVMVCDRCGVKYTTSTVRGSRFGHIEFHEAIPHPLGTTDNFIDVFPVVPASIWESKSGNMLVDLYHEVIRCVDAESWQALTDTIERLSLLLLPTLVIAESWGLADARILAKGLGLAPTDRT